MRIGIDVGGTHTDAVLMDGSRLAAVVKRPTTADVRSGIADALRSLKDSGGKEAERADAVVVGTTQFINAVVTTRGLAGTAVVRFTIPSPFTLPPMTGWPDGLVGALGRQWYLCGGGHEYDGREIVPFDVAEFRRILDQVARSGARAIALSSVFSPINIETEQRAAAMIADRLPGIAVSMSHEVGQLGLLGRENATILNAALGPLADQLLDDLVATVRATGIKAPVYVSQNDGTVLDVDHARQYPIFTFASGAVNSAVGVGRLTGVDRAVVVDIGGSTTDIGVLHEGAVRFAVDDVRTGGVRTNFRMPDVRSIPIGGGTVVRFGETDLIGPDTVGAALIRRARVFGGDELTLTDLAVAGGRLGLGRPRLVADLSGTDVERVLAKVAARITAEVVSIRATTEDAPVAVVGGGAFLLPPGTLPGAVMRPAHGDSANAIGAAFAKAGSRVERVAAVPVGGAAEAVAAAVEEAVDRAIALGAAPGTVTVLEKVVQPVPYLPGNAMRIRVRAVGELARLEDLRGEASRAATS